jgi:hypothetical protein
MRGLQVQAFHEFETAILWMWSDTEISVEEKHGVDVPIFRRGVKNRTTSLADGIHSPTAPGLVRELKRNRP